MYKEIRMKVYLRQIAMIIWVGSILTSCDPDPAHTDDLIQEESVMGTLQVEFNMPEFHILPSQVVHRAMLCVAYTPDSLDRQEYLDCANVSDRVTNYKFSLLPGTYYYMAGITCSAQGDSCLWGGFPGGQMGLQWAIVQVSVETDKITVSSPAFQ